MREMVQKQNFEAHQCLKWADSQRKSKENVKGIGGNKIVVPPCGQSTTSVQQRNSQGRTEIISGCGTTEAMLTRSFNTIVEVERILSHGSGIMQSSP